MSKKLLSTLIASLFAAAPALAQSDDPMRVEGSATLGGIYNNQSVQDATKLEEYQDLGNGVMSNVGLRGRNSTTWFTGLRRELRPHRPVHVPARRHVRHLQGRCVPERHAAQFPHGVGAHAVQRFRRQCTDGDVPEPQCQHVERGHTRV